MPANYTTEEAGDQAAAPDPDPGPAAIVPATGFRGFKFGVALPGDRYCVFISSPGDCQPARRHVRSLIYGACNPVLMSYSRAFLQPMMWEDALAQRVEGQSHNDVFVEMALRCHATLVLLKTRLGEGTREEVERLLALPHAQRKPLSVVRFALEPEEVPTEDPKPLDDFVRALGSEENVSYREPGPMGSPEAQIELTKTLGGYMFAAHTASQRSELTDAP